MYSQIIFAAVSAFLLCTGFGPLAIIYLQRLKVGQNIRDQGPRRHQAKAGTPTMGGLVIIFAFTLTTLYFAPKNAFTLLALGFTLGYGILGFWDDFKKLALANSLGLRAREKLLGQFGLAAILALWVMGQPGLGTWVLLPIVGARLELGYWYIPFVLVLIVFISNAVNLTDGLDGLAAGTTTIALLAYVPITLSQGRWELAIFAGSVAGACLGFLWFNSYPAQIFMGDTGSLALGGALTSIAVLTKTELWLVLIGGIFVLEGLSVIIQVIFYRITGGRIFRMSPIHHHFELVGWPENRVVIRFWILGVVLALFGVGIWYYS
ncbi:MAG: phospho-N-acetylmuramoyl-pentapeptide-transferase [Firmicutes bacterium]|nr:phospho-N-acetylmuramoyl-pentapeptide-transferase [Bacillota bacterium]